MNEMPLEELGQNKQQQPAARPKLKHRVPAVRDEYRQTYKKTAQRRLMGFPAEQPGLYKKYVLLTASTINAKFIVDCLNQYPKNAHERAAILRHRALDAILAMSELFGEDFTLQLLMTGIPEVIVEGYRLHEYLLDPDSMEYDNTDIQLSVLVGVFVNQVLDYSASNHTDWLVSTLSKFDLPEDLLDNILDMVLATIDNIPPRTIH